MKRRPIQPGPTGATQDWRTSAAPKAGKQAEAEAVLSRFCGTPAGVADSNPKDRPLWDVVGSAVTDATYESPEVSIGEGTVHFKTPTGWEAMPYEGPPLSCECGGKRVAAADPGAVAERVGAARTTGGGMPNSIRELARLCRAKQLPLRLRAINASASCRALDTEWTHLGVEHVSLELTPLLINFVLSGPRQRCVFKSPAAPFAPLDRQWDRVTGCTNSRPTVRLINSARPLELVRIAVHGSLREGTRLYSLATTSIAVDACLECLLPFSRVTQFNLEDFAGFAKPLAVECPLEERLTAVPAVGETITNLVHALPFPARDLVVTMGGTGMVVYDSNNGCICHVGLNREGLTAAQKYLPRDFINGIGDRTFAALVLAYETGVTTSASSRLVGAACQAWADVLEAAAPLLRPKPTWFKVTRLACDCFGTGWTELQPASSSQPDGNRPQDAR